MYIFTHIPKTAGTTFRKFLWTHIEEKSRIAIGDSIQYEMQLLTKQVDRQRTVQWLFGHICYGWHDLFESRKEGFHYVTVLRDPIDRVRSLFDYARRSKSHYLYSRIKDMNFGEFMSSGVTNTADNGMVRQLCGLDRFVRGSGQDMKIPYGEIDGYHLNLAIENLKTYWLVGISERYQAFQNAVCRELGWPIKMMERHNVYSPKWQTDIRPYKDVARDALTLDYELYKVAKELAP